MAPYRIRTFRGIVVLPSAKHQGHRQAKSSRIEFRAKEDNRSSFSLAQGQLAAQRVLADREQFVLDVAGQQEWERINSRPARSLPGLARLLERPSPFAQPAVDQPQG
jgi:uncharacterized protein (DUF1778 family)